MWYNLGERSGKFQLCPMWRYTKVSQWAKGMLKLYNLIKAGLVHVTYTEYQNLPAATTDALVAITAEYNELTAKKVDDG